MNLYRGVSKAVPNPPKPVITLWAEEKGPLEDGAYEFSYGDGSRTHYCGYTMMCPGRVLKMGLSGGDLTTSTTVSLTVNRDEKGAITKEARALIGPIKPRGRGVFQAAVKTFTPPIELSEGDVINFKSAKTATRALATIVSLLIEIDA